VATPNRRGFFRIAGLGALTAFWTDWERAQAGGPVGRARAKSVIMIFNAGAPSHIDLWDPKPDAPENVRGLFKPIVTNVPGVRVTELLPRLARQVDRYSIIRTVHHHHTQHNSGMYWSIVGRPYRLDSTLINPSHADHPSFGTLVGWLAQRDGYSSPLPPYVITPAPHCDSTVYITPGQYGACLGAKYDPLVLNADPNAANFQVPNLGARDDVGSQRLGERRALLGKLDDRTEFLPAELSGPFGVNQSKAFSLVSSADVRKAFDLPREPAQVRDRYGRHSWGQSHLLARRLVESGVRFVSTVNGPSIVWDTHQDNFQRMKTKLVPPMEMAFSALLDDLHERGLLDTTLVVWIGDFGRTPAINTTAGRDHWPHCYSVVLAGGGIRGGRVVGESDKIGAYPKDRPITPADVHATVFTALGYDPHAITYTSPEGRPLPLSEGTPISELL
jgi:hypothetical protein